MGPIAHDRSDEDLLLAARHEPEAFALFYRRHVRALAAYFWRRSRDAETTADLTAETFAAALDGCARFDPSRGRAIGARRPQARLARPGGAARAAGEGAGMTDFYAQLERELVDAGHRRAAQGRLRRAVMGRGRPLLATGAAVLAAAGGVALVPALRSASSSGPAHSGPPPAPVALPASPASPGRAPLRGVRTAVLNGTTRPGLGRVVAGLLEDRGATIDAVANASDQSLRRTVVEYRRGRAGQARRVADVLGVRELAPLTGEDEHVAPRAQVVVRVGRDRCLPVRCVRNTPGVP
jgi:hypothetical protein